MGYTLDTLTPALACSHCGLPTHQYCNLCGHRVCHECVPVHWHTPDPDIVLSERIIPDPELPRDADPDTAALEHSLSDEAVTWDTERFDVYEADTDWAAMTTVITEAGPQYAWVEMLTRNDRHGTQLGLI